VNFTNFFFIDINAYYNISHYKLGANINFLLEYLVRIRVLLAGKRALFALSLLGLVTGLVVGSVIILFRFTTEYSQMSFLPGANPENYEALSWQIRLFLTTAGGLILGLLFYFVSKVPLRVGVIHVLERLSYNEGNLPFKNLLLQFVGGAVAIISGQSVGREGQVFIWAQAVPVYWVNTYIYPTIVFVLWWIVVQQRDCDFL